MPEVLTRDNETTPPGIRREVRDSKRSFVDPEPGSPFLAGDAFSFNPRDNIPGRAGEQAWGTRVVLPIRELRFRFGQMGVIEGSVKTPEKVHHSTRLHVQCPILLNCINSVKIGTMGNVDVKWSSCCQTIFLQS
jgi:hypothetical protein